MKLRALTVWRMPGIDRPFRVEGLADGLNLVVGPNGSGKTTLCRAVRALLWAEESAGGPVSLAGEWEDGGAALRVEREGVRVTWQRDGTEVERPGLPDDRFTRCFTLGVRDLLLDERPTDATIASEIRSQMSGGYDVEALLDGPFAERAQEGRAEDSRIRRLQDRLRQLRSEGAALADDEDRARELEEQFAEAREATKRLESLRTARSVVQARTGLEEVRRELAGLPAGMERIEGGEADRIEEAEADLADFRGDLARCRHSREDAERRIEAGQLAGGPAEESDWKAWLDRARELQGLEGELARAERARAEAEGRRDALGAGLDPGGVAGASRRLGAEDLTRVELFLHRVDRLRAQRSALEAERRLLGEREPREAVSRRQVEQGIEALDRWLSAAAPRRPVRAGWALSAALAAVLAGAASGLLLHWAGWVLCGAGVGALALLFWVRPAASETRSCRGDFEALGLASPAAWTPESVRDRRRDLRDGLDALREDERLAERRSVLDGKLVVTAEAEAELEAERRALRAALGVDAGGDVSLVVLADQVRRYHAADEERGEAAARVRLLDAKRRELLAQINGFLSGAGLEPGSDATALIRRLEELRERSAKLEEARRDLEKQAAGEAGLLQKIEGLERRAEAIFRRVGLEPGDREGLNERLRELQRYRELRKKEDRFRDSANEGVRALAGRDDPLGLSAEQLGVEIAALEELASRTDGLSREIGSIEERVRRARSDDAVERVMAELAAVRDELSDRLEAKLGRAAGACLLRSIRDEYDRASRPEVLSRAAELFARFTRHEYELLFDPRGGEPGLRAREASSGKGRSLAELSDATRIQLLLASRLAFATRADRKRRVPLFLDEVLTTSDPARFAAVAESLLVLVREEGRQVFYLTSNPADAERWRTLLEPEERERLRLTDLAETRRLAGAATEIEEIEVAPLPEPPSPEGLSAGQYALAIGAPPLEPNRPVPGLHLIHLLHDDLELLHALLREGVSTLGQWRALVKLGEAARLAGGERAARLSALGDLAAAFFEAWAIGRGRSLDAEALRGADGLSDKYRGAVTEMAAERNGDGRELLQAMEERDPRVSGFREKQLEAFRGWLIGEGYLDPREPLDEPAVQGRVLEALGEHVRAGRLSTADVTAHVHRLFELSGRGSKKKFGASGAGGGRETPETP